MHTYIFILHFDNSIKSSLMSAKEAKPSRLVVPQLCRSFIALLVLISKVRVEAMHLARDVI